MPLCSEEECDQSSRARGLCKKHYDRAISNGNLPPRILVRCSTCGSRLKVSNVFGVCTKNEQCRAEYARRQSLDYYHRHSSTILEQGRIQRQVKKSPRIYAIHFPSAELLKIGKTERLSSPLSRTRKVVKSRGLNSVDGLIIYTQIIEGVCNQGILVIETRMQSCLSFRYEMGWQASSGRMLEWFKVGPVTSEELVIELSNIYRSMPSLLKCYINMD